MNLKMFEGRSLIIATKHGKEQVIAPILESALGVKCVTADIDTDQFGTFSGEIERKEDPMTTARKKCAAALAHTNCDLALASEGSFGGHPSIFFVPADDELLLLMDRKNGLEIFVRELSTTTNLNSREVSSENELHDFAIEALFPSHGLILRKKQGDTDKIFKGINDWTELRNCYHKLRDEEGKVFVETDMRAMMNPSRMHVIEKATYKLLEKIQRQCPACKTPGYSSAESRLGLPCSQCHFPTKSVYSHIFTCSKCAYTEEVKFPCGKSQEEPMFCDICNP